MPKAARLGDNCAGHGCFPPTPIIAGSGDVSINGMPAARKGDAVLLHACPCPYVPHGVHGRSISAGSSNVSINGKPAARVGDAIGCGGSVSAGSGNVFIGDTPYNSPAHDCGEGSAQKKSSFLRILPLVEPTKAIWTCPPYIEEAITKAAEKGESAVPLSDDNASDIITSEGVFPDSKSVISPEMEAKILYGQRSTNKQGNPTNRLIGAHSGNISNNHQDFAVETLSVNADGSRNVKLITQFDDGNISKIKNSTLFPESWSDSQILSAVSQIADGAPLSTRTSDGASLYQSTVNGVDIEVIKVGDNVTAGYPCGQGRTDPLSFGGN